MTEDLIKSKFKQDLIKRDIEKYFSVKSVGVLNEDEKDLLAYVYVQSNDLGVSEKVLNAWRNADQAFIRC